MPTLNASTHEADAATLARLARGTDTPHEAERERDARLELYLVTYRERYGVFPRTLSDWYGR